MKKQLFKRSVSLLCATAMVVGLCAGLAQTAFAALGYWPDPLEIPNEYYQENTTLQPYGSCFLIDELKNWSPDNDPDARYNRGSIPLAERWMGPNVNPLASRDAGVMPLAMGNARASQGASQGGDGASVYAFNNFQYVEVYNFWGGSSAEGPIAIPSPELIDSAHRNGVPVTGTIFIPWGDSVYGNRFVREMVEKDAQGRFIAADKLIEIAQYYGFDGYIFNAESGTGIEGFREFLIYLQENKPDNFTISWYNGAGNLGEGDIKRWMQDGDTRIADHWWMDMGGGWSGPSSSVESAINTGVSPWKIHSTWENWPMSGGAKGGNYQSRLGADGKVISSLGILAPTASLMASKTPEEFMNVQDQKLWVGPTFDPSSTYRPANEFCGFASLVADRTPVLGTDFVTNFTAGNGHKFYEDGKVVGKEDGWYNRSIGDVLPTWRWIIESEGQKLNAIIDYADAWYAGTSMKLSGNMDANKPNHVKLYSCNMQITDKTKFDFVYKTPVDGVKVELGLCFGDTYDAQNFKFYDLATTADGNWNTTTIDLSGDAGKTAIAISLRFTAADGVNDYAINVGQMAITTDKTAPEGASNVTLDEAIYPTDKSMEARIYWENGENAFMNRIYRVHQDGTRELVGVTPSDAFYLGSYEKEEGETACTFEIVSYSKNGVKGGTATIDIAWPTEVKDGFVPVFDEGPNLALKMPAVSLAGVPNQTGVHQLNDGTVLNGSKWCVDLVTSGAAVIDLGENKDIQRWVTYHANCPGAGEGVSFNTVSFDLQYAPDDGKPLLNGDTQESRDRVYGLDFRVADMVTGNKQDITDRNLEKPITARYIKLNVTQSDNCPWRAIRVYELQLFEKAGIDNTASPYERNVTVRNNEGAKDQVIVDNVQMIYSSGSYAQQNGTFHEDTGTVRLFTDLTSQEPIAVSKAVQPTEGHKQRGVGIATFENLNLNPEGGRLYYDVLDGSGTEVKNSRRASVYYAPETGTAPTAPSSTTLERTTRGFQLRDQYGKFTATGLEDGTSVWIYPAADAKTAILRTMPAENGTVSIERVPLKKEGGSIFYELHTEGKPVSQMYELAYGDPMTLNADLTGLNELIAKCSAISQDDCTSATWPAFQTALTQAQEVAKTTATGAQAEQARANLNEAYANLRFKGNVQRLDELCQQYGTYKAEDYTPASFEVFTKALDAAKNAVETRDFSNQEIEQIRIALEDAVRGLKAAEQITITGVTVAPATVSVQKGTSQQFTATVEGTGGPSQEVTWTLTGNESSSTTLVDGLLSVADDETASALSVVATSVADSSFSGSATVTVTEEGAPVDPPQPGESELLSRGATVVGTNGTSFVGEEARMAFDGKLNTKWCVERTPKYVVFDVKEPAVANRLVVTHAGGATSPEDERFNTNDFALYVLDPSKYTDEQFLALDGSTQRAVMDDDANWKLLKDYVGNDKNVTDDALQTNIQSRIYRLKVTDGDDNWWQGADTVRIYEIELYGSKGGTVTPPQEVTITIDPKEITIDNAPGLKQQFTATVSGADDVSVTWSVSGNTSQDTRADNGLLFLGKDETANTLTVTATSNADPSKSASATVTIEIPSYSVRISESIANGTITADKQTAKEGETVTLTVEPAQGYELVAGSLKFNGTPIEGNSFVMPREDVVITAEFAKIIDLTEDVEAAKAAADAAEASAQKAQEYADAAKAAAEEAAKTTAEDKTAAKAAQAAATEAQAQADAAKAAAETAKTAAAEAEKAAQEKNEAAVKEARKTAEDAAQTAAQKTDEAQASAQTAQIQKIAQQAQVSFEEAEKIAAQAQVSADEAKTAADEAEGSTAENKDAAEKARKAAQEAQKAADEAKKAAQDAQTAVQTAKDAKDQAAAQAAAEAAKYARDTAQRYGNVADLKAAIAEALLHAQNTQQKAEEAEKEAAAAKLSAAKYEAMLELAVSYNREEYDAEGLEQIDEIVAQANEKISAAASEEEVKTALEEAKAAIGEVVKAAQKHPFTDVSKEDWFNDAVLFVYHKGLMKGVTTTKFAPNATMDRGMLVTTLYRMAGSPDVQGDVKFEDVNPDAYYYDALVWATEKHIVTGVTETKFAPKAEVTRQQIATFLYRYAQCMEMDTSVEGDLSGYADASQIQSYAQDAMSWAVGTKILEGVGDNRLAPAHDATRAQVATMLLRFANLQK